MKKIIKYEQFKQRKWAVKSKIYQTKIIKQNYQI